LKILLTGASGFLGSSLARSLRIAGHQVALLLRPTSNLARLRGLDAEFDIGRCDSDTDIEAYVVRTEPDCVIHTACSYGRHGESPLQIADSNIRFGLAIMQALLASKVPVTFVNTGTALPPEVSAYAMTKHQFATLGRHLAAQNSIYLRFVNVLLQHMLGPGDNPSNFTMSVIRACRHNEPELMLTAGGQRRDFVYIDDVIDAYTLIVNQHATLDTALDIEVGSGVSPTIREFVETVHRLTRSKTKLFFGALPYRDNEAMYSRADISRLKTMGWFPKFDLEQAIKTTIDLEFAR
jgi:CDP-paratose synthetase